MVTEFLTNWPNLKKEEREKMGEDLLNIFKYFNLKNSSQSNIYNVEFFDRLAGLAKINCDFYKKQEGK